MKVWIARALVLIVFGVNLYCIVSFIFTPERFIHTYELSGVPGTVAIQGIGIAFLMWNVTYPLVIVRPDKYRVLYVLVMIQQVVGLMGETFILLTLPAGHDILWSNLLRFILFDAFGLLLLLIGFFLARKPSSA